ncbi:type III secretion system chaperone [Hyalangium versicolor]|uniref:type III secretion system chaperone n=1 Tax=Hyalangium versicolor TaxID=2861190 RepID=UPI001CCA40F8|nr:type III secretion system chaperone [Hyalangium versicolor]
MTREGAQRLVQSFVRPEGPLQSPGLNAEGFGGLVMGGAQLYFEWHEDTQALECSALVYKFHEPPKPGVLETFQKEEKEGTDTGGGTVSYEPENRGLYLSRTYTVVPDERTFAKEMKRLMKASLRWSDEVLDRVASRVFHPEELEQK